MSTIKNIVSATVRLASGEGEAPVNTHTLSPGHKPSPRHFDRPWAHQPALAAASRDVDEKAQAEEGH